MSNSSWTICITKKNFFKENIETGNYENMNPIWLLFLKEFV